MQSDNFLSEVKQTQKSFIETFSVSPLKEMLQHHYQQEGKLLRPFFGYNLANLLGLDPAKIIPWCSACEMLHNSTLIHDDLQDGDKYRRGIKSLWFEFTPNQAINAGDFLMMLAPKIVLESKVESNIAVNLISLFSEFSSKIVLGQSIEFDIRNHLKDSNLPALYKKCIEYKTSELFSGLARGVAIMANLEQKKVDDIYLAFKELGIIFQYQDDILDLFGEKKRDEIGCDIKEGKISCLVVEYLSMFPKDEHEVMPIILKDRGQTTSEEVQYVISTFEDVGVLKSTISTVAEKVATIRDLQFTKENSEFSKLILGIILKVLQPIKHIEEKAIENRLWTI